MSVRNIKLKVNSYKPQHHLKHTEECFADLGKFGQAKFAYSGSTLGLSKFTQLPQLPMKMMLSLKVVKSDSKISNLLG